MVRHRVAFLGGIAIILSGCVTVDRTAATSLGTAGENATKAISAQTTTAQQAVGEVSQWWAVHDALVCVNVIPKLRSACLAGVGTGAPPPTVASAARLADVIEKRKKAIDDLNAAYTAFADLSSYNAGQAAASAMRTAFSSINAFGKAAAALYPPAGAFVPVSATVETVASGAVAVFANNRQDKEIRAANNDLRVANDALFNALSLESNAMASILVVLQDERVALYQSGLAAGLIAPVDVLTPVFTQAYPAIHLASPPAANEEIIKLAAQKAIEVQARATIAAIPKSYADSLSALHAVSSQHEKFAQGQRLTLAAVEIEVNDLEADLTQSEPASPIAAKTASK